MEISTSTYYSERKISREEKEEQDADIRGKIEQLRVTFPRAGYRPLLHHLKRSGVLVGETRLRRILGQSGLFLKPKKKFVKTTQSDLRNDNRLNQSSLGRRYYVY
jgi:putative transposase